MRFRKVDKTLKPYGRAKRRRVRHAGCTSMLNRTGLTGILFVPKTGVSWGRSLQEAGPGSQTACRPRPGRQESRDNRAG